MLLSLLCHTMSTEIFLMDCTRIFSYTDLLIQFIYYTYFSLLLILTFSSTFFSFQITFLLVSYNQGFTDIKITFFSKLKMINFPSKI